MMNTYPNCGVCRADKLIDPDEPFAICPVCTHRETFRSLPLLMIAGAGDSGWSTACRHLWRGPRSLVALDTDALCRVEFDKSRNWHRDFFETWLRLC